MTKEMQEFFTEIEKMDKADFIAMIKRIFRIDTDLIEAESALPKTITINHSYDKEALRKNVIQASKLQGWL